MKNILFTTHLDDNFIDGALVMLYSMKKNVKDFMEYPIRIMHSTTIAGISQENQNKLKKLIPHIEFKDINKKEYIEAPVQYPKHRTAFLSLECFKNTKYDKVFFFDCDMLCIDDITEGIINAPDDMVSGCGGSPKDINCGLFVVGKKWLNDDIYHKMVNNINKHDLSRITQGYDVKRETKIIHWAGALPDKNSRVRPPYPKPWQDNEDSNPVTKLWYKYKKEMLNELKL